MKMQIVRWSFLVLGLASSASAGMALAGRVQRWEAPCEEPAPGEWRCGSPSQLLETKEFRIPVELPAVRGDATRAELALFDGVTVRLFAAWPAADEPVIQTRVDLRGSATCATTDYLRTEKLSPLVCAARVGSRLIGVTLHELRFR